MNANDIITSKLLTKVDSKSVPPDAFQLSTNSAATAAGAAETSQSDEVNVIFWKKSLPYLPPKIGRDKEELVGIKGEIILVTLQQLKKNEIVDYFLNLLRPSHESDQTYDIANYYVKHNKRLNIVYDPQFSPDGTKVLFKDGWPFDSHGTFKLYILNITTGKLHSGPSQMMSFPIVKWSPDGRYLLFTSGGGNQGEENNPYYPRTFYVFDIANNQSYKIDSSPQYKYYYWTKDDTVIYLKNTKVYESSANGLKHQEVLKYAENLLVSPDGNYLIYRGYKDEAEEIKAIESMKVTGVPGITAPEPIAPTHLCIYDRKANRKTFFNEGLEYAQFIWMHGTNNQAIALTSTVTYGGGDVTVNTVDLPSGKIKAVVTLPKLKGNQGTPNDLDFQTKLVAVTKDNQYVIVRRVQDDPKAKPGFTHKISLEAISLKNGKQVTILEDAYHTWPIRGVDFN